MGAPAERECYSRCGETCPAVDAAFSDFESDIERYVAEYNWQEVRSLIHDLVLQIKEVGTEKMRQAFIELCEDYITQQDEIAELRRRVELLEEQQ